MSMAKKIFAAIILLAVVAVAIAGIAAYSIAKMSAGNRQLELLVYRISALGTLDSALLDRRGDIIDIVRETEESAMQTIINALVGPEKAAAEAVVEYDKHLPKDASPAQRSKMADYQKLWQRYVDLTAQVAKLSLQNSNGKALILFKSIGGQLTKIDTDIEAVALELSKSDSDTDGDAGSMLRRLRAIIYRLRVYVNEYIPELDLATSDKYRELVLAENQKILKFFDDTINNLRPTNPDGARKIEAIRKAIDDLLTPTIKQVVALVDQDTNVKATRLLQGDAEKARAEVTEFLEASLVAAHDITKATVEDADALAKKVHTLMLFVSIIGILLGVTIAYLVVAAVVRQLNTIIYGLSESAKQVDIAANSISGASQSLAEGASEQAASLEETSAASEETAAMTRQNAENGDKVKTTSEKNDKLIADGAENINDMSKSMGEINDSAEKIGKIIKTIEDIAFQTNLLALNAAVEAARAGEAGKGFAVVSEEVRNLAGRSAQAARDTTELIGGTVTRVKRGYEIAGLLEKSFKQIEEGSSQVSGLINQIVGATKEQATGVEQISIAITQLDQVTQVNASSAEKTASASEELSGQAATLSDMVRDLLRIVTGKDTTGSASAAPRKPIPAPLPAKNSAGKSKALAAPQASGVGKVIPLNDDDF